MRAGPAAALALIAAVLGGAVVLAVAKAGGWLHGTTRTVVVRESVPSAGDANAPVIAARPLLGNGFQPAQIYRTILGFLANAPTAEQIAAYTPSPEIEQRLRDLLDRERVGKLTPSERAELDELERIGHLMVMLKAGALPSLTAQP